MSTTPTILDVKNLKIHYRIKSGWFSHRVVHAVEGVNFTLQKGEILGIVGESGCGKSSLARALVGLTPITSGSIVFEGTRDLAQFAKKDWTSLNNAIQFIFQDPVASLDPRMNVYEIISEPLIIGKPYLTKREVLKEVLYMMGLVGIPQAHIHRYPQEFSGGQCQRIGIARALITKPKLIICDESVSALDVSIKAQIINLLKELQKTLDLTILFISHDLGIVKHISDRVMVMYLGHVMELSNKHFIYLHPYHPYTKALLAAIPTANPLLERGKKVEIIKGDLPSPLNPPKGCVFHTRCPLAEFPACQMDQALRLSKEGSLVACWKAPLEE